MSGRLRTCSRRIDERQTYKLTTRGYKMRITSISRGVLLAALSSLWALPASAVNTEKHPIPYFVFSPQYLITDSVRNSDNGTGYQLTFGVPLESGNSAVELRYFDAGYERPGDRRDNYQTGLLIDYVRDFGAIGGDGANGFFGSIKPFALVGGGFVEEDIFSDKHLHLTLDVGGGVIVPFGFTNAFNGRAVRLDTHVQAQANDETCPAGNTNGCSKKASSLIDYAINLGIQIPMTWFFDRPVAAVAPAEDCPVAVVDPATGRKDCSADSDGDGVGDGVDECPGTPSGTPVNRQGCARSQLNNDTDGDGVEKRGRRVPRHPAWIESEPQRLRG